MRQYLDLLKDIRDNGCVMRGRNGETLSLFGTHMRIDLREGFPIATTKKVNWKNIVLEMLWFLSGDSSTKFFHKHGVTFWDAWIESDGNLPEAYGEYWRKYPDHNLTLMQGDPNCSFRETVDGTLIEINGLAYIKRDYFDQIAAIVGELKTNPNSRRLVLTNWCVFSAWKAKLPPCHVMAIFNVKYTKQFDVPYLNCMMTQRSADFPVGSVYNITSYALLMHIIGRLSNIEPGEFVYNMADCHIYANQLKHVDEQLKRTPGKLPTLEISDRIKTLEDLDELIVSGTTEEIMDCFRLHDYNPQAHIPYEVSI